jgi:AraC-like DNA-binding protein
VREESIIQIGTGKFLTDSALIATPNTALFRVQVKVRSVGVTILDPEFLAFVLPIFWRGEYIINGETVRQTRLYMPGVSDGYYIRGDRRETFGIVLRRTQFIETVSALRGVGPEDVDISKATVELTSVAATSLRLRLAKIFERDKLAIENLDKILYEVLIDTYLSASPEADKKYSRARSPAQIVRKAEECFMAAEEKPVSLADLCRVAGVSKSGLYTAFHNTCGVPPLEYFRKRRLMQARSLLLKNRPHRGAVKRAALDVGLTELGRFSLEYRQLFGELPSATLHKSID